MRFDLHKVIILRPTKLSNGGWVRIIWCAASHWSYFRSQFAGKERDHIELRAWRFLFEYKRDPE